MSNSEAAAPEAAAVAVRAASVPARRARIALGTLVEVGALPGRTGCVQAALAAALEAIDLAQRLWSFHDADSELSRLNARPGEWIVVSRHTLRLLRLAVALMRRSGGRFDITVGGWLVQMGVLPDHAVAAGGPPALIRGEAADIEFSPGRRIRLRRPVRLTLDGIAKGFAVDMAIAALRRGGCRAGWVNAGGDLRVFGPLDLPVQLRGPDDRPTPLGGLRDGAMASSVVVAGPNRYVARFPGCIVGPAATPDRTEPGTWTVLARSAWRADALTKVAANTPAAERRAAIERLGGRLLQIPL